MNLFAIPSLVALLASVCLGLMIIGNKSKLNSNNILLLLVSSVIIITFGEFMQRSSSNTSTSLIWAKFSFIGMILLPSIVLHFSFIFPKMRKLKNHFLILIYIPSFIFSCFLFNDLLISGINENQYLGYSAEFGKLLPYFFAFVLVYIDFGILNILMSYYGFNKEKKYKNIRYWIFGLIILLVGTAVLFFFPSNPDISLFPLTSSLGIVSIIFLAYALIIYKFTILPVAFESIAKNINDGIIIFDIFGNVIRVNDSANKMLGLKKEHIGNSFEKSVFHNISNLEKPNLFKDFINEADTKQNQIIEGKLITKEPKQFLEVNITSISGKSHIVFGKIVILHDVTKKEKMEKDLRENTLKIVSKTKELVETKKELERTNEKLLETDRLKSEFVSIVSHDLGTPMTVMKGNLELLMDETLGGVNDKQKRALGMLSRNIEQLNFLRKDTLDLSQMDLGKLSLDKSKVTIYSLVETCVSDLMGLARTKNQIIKVYIPHEYLVYCDKNKIKQVITNYISNAIKYTQEGGDIYISAKEENDFIDIIVKDNGRGIPKSELDNVFKRFFRVGSKVLGSTGLGLAIVKGIVEAHEGRVWCESEEEKGSEFHFTLQKYNPNLENQLTEEALLTC